MAVRREDVSVKVSDGGLLVPHVRKFPQIIIPGPKAPLEMPQGQSAAREGKCSKCGQHWRFRVGSMDTYGPVDSDADENRARALNKFLAYIRKGICPCCWTSDDRVFIAKHARSVVYERLD